MTTIAAVQGPGWLVIGSDSQVSADNRTYRLPRGFGKLVHNGPYVLGTAGDLRAVNILTHDFEPPVPGKIKGVSLDRFMVSRFIPKLRKTFEANAYGKEGEHESVILACLGGVIYEIGQYYECLRDDDGLYAIGSGGHFALGALRVLRGDAPTVLEAEEMVRSALLAAAACDSNTSEPVMTITQVSTPL
jgi:ATP-dependent protease HslVU (ClpYQ) peptidase subunit